MSDPVAPRVRENARVARGAVRLSASLALALLCACASVSESVRGRIDRRDLDGAIREGTAWLDGKGRKAERAEAERVRLLVAEARLEKALATGEPGPLREFREAHAEPLYGPLARRAHEREAALAWPRLGPAAGIEALRSFREAYAGTPEALLARERELVVAEAAAARGRSTAAEAAFREGYGSWPEAGDAVRRSRARELEIARAEAEGSVEGERRFRGLYGSWPDAAALLPGSRRSEARAALAAAVRAGTTAALAAFRREYAGWAEAEEPLAEAYGREAGLALEVAGEDVEALGAVARDYPEPPWPERAAERIGAVLAGRVARAAERGEIPGDEEVEALLAPGVPLDTVRSAASKDEGRIWAAVASAGRPAGYRLFLALFPGSPRAAEAAAAEERAAWAEAEGAGSAEAWLRFAEDHPGSARAREAERSAALLARVADPDPSLSRAVVTHVRKLPSGETELTVDVERCGERVAGLRREAFEIYLGTKAQAVTGFLSLEEDRPLSVAFAIDLSGSMAAEREAVRAAVLEFAETFRFRGRKASLSLVTFNEKIRDARGPAASVEEFRRWLAHTGGAEGGGGGEDTLGSLLASADLLGRGQGERVAVLLTDEPLQMNLGGRLRVARAGSGCDRVTRSLAAFRRCADDSCRLEAYRRASPLAETVARACFAAWGRAACARNIDESVFGLLLDACQGGGSGPYVDPASRHYAELRASLSRAGVRPYFVVPTGLALDGPFAGLAASLGGAAIPVDDDSDDPATFVGPLLAIADQLSKQYVVRFRPEAGLEQASPKVLVRLDHEWTRWSDLAGAVSALAPAGLPKDGCQELVAATGAGELLRSEGCGRSFRAWPLPAAGSVRALAADGAGGLHVLGERALLFVGPGAEPAVVDPGSASVRGLQTGPDGAAWVTGLDASGRPAVARRARGAPAFAEVALPGIDSPPLALLPGAGEAVCAVTSREARLCRDDRGAVAVARVEGLAGEPRGGTVLPLPGRPGGFLWAPERGGLLRTLDRGGHFAEALPEAAGGWRLSVRPGRRPLVCAASSSAVRCSEDAGLSWFRAGRDAEGAVPVAIASAGGDVYVGRGPSLERLTRVINRDIPSSSFYFATDSDVPSAAIRPFAARLGAELARDPALRLRVEGHADRRGSDAHNEDLALRRARAVARLVGEAGAREAQIETLGFGSRRPVRPGESAEDLGRNRRVELLLMQPMGGSEGERTGACPDRGGSDSGEDPDAVEGEEDDGS